MRPVRVPTHAMRARTAGTANIALKREGLAAFVRGGDLLAALPLDFVLRLRFRLGLPLHIARGVCSAASKRYFVVDHVSLTAVRISTLAHELIFRGRATLYSTVFVV